MDGRGGCGWNGRVGGGEGRGVVNASHGGLRGGDVVWCEDEVLHPGGPALLFATLKIRRVHSQTTLTEPNTPTRPPPSRLQPRNAIPLTSTPKSHNNHTHQPCHRDVVRPGEVQSPFRTSTATTRSLTSSSLRSHPTRRAPNARQPAAVHRRRRFRLHRHHCNGGRAPNRNESLIPTRTRTTVESSLTMMTKMKSSKSVNHDYVPEDR